MKLEWLMSGPLYLCPFLQVIVCDTLTDGGLFSLPHCASVCVCARVFLLAGTCTYIYPECIFICHFAGCHCRVCRVFSNSWTFRWYASTSVS